MTKCKECQTEMNGTAFPLCLRCRKKQALSILIPSKVLPPEVPRVILQNIPLISEDKTNPYKDSTFIYGPSGSGKSHKAAEIMYSEMLERGPSNFSQFGWVNVPQLLFNIRQSFNSSETGYDERFLVERYSTIPWLCLDDLGVEKTSEWVLQTLYLIINQRYENIRTTIVTSNLCLGELAEKLGDSRITSRLTGMCKTIKLGGKDRRGVK